MYTTQGMEKITTNSSTELQLRPDGAPSVPRESSLKVWQPDSFNLDPAVTNSSQPVKPDSFNPGQRVTDNQLGNTSTTNSVDIVDENDNSKNNIEDKDYDKTKEVMESKNDITFSDKTEEIEEAEETKRTGKTEEMEGGKDDEEIKLENEIGDNKEPTDTDDPNPTNDTVDISTEDEGADMENPKERGEDGEELGSHSSTEKPNHDNTDFYFKEESTESEFVISFWPR